MRYFPAFLDLLGRPAVVVGGTPAALAKAELLTRAGAKIRHFTTSDAIAAGDLKGAALVFIATGDVVADARIAALVTAAGLPVNVVDRPELSSFVTPALIDRDPVLVAVGTAGTAPLLARRIREAIEALLPERLGALARFGGAFRAAVKATLKEPVARRRFWQRFFDGPVARRVLAGDEAGARESMLALVNRAGRDGAIGSVGLGSLYLGSVALVGAGPGDPDLLTLRALRALQDADVVVFDRLVAAPILARARRDAERIGVGKTPGGPSVGQDEINALLVAKARAGHRVVRLKGGDPFIFGRGGEEVDALQAAGIAVEVIPGITAATAAAASAALPLTHRGVAQAVTFVTGHGQRGEPEVDWAALAQLDQTLVVYMGVGAARRTAERLIAGGMRAATPVAVIENASRPEERLVSATLATLASQIVTYGITGPAIIVIGDVAARADAARHAALPLAIAS